MKRAFKLLGMGFLVSAVLVSILVPVSDSSNWQKIATGDIYKDVIVYFTLYLPSNPWMLLYLLPNTVFFAVLFYFLNVLSRKVLSVLKPVSKIT